jgi:multicomponent Na+:H+ antiporter subunit E
MFIFWILLSGEFDIVLIISCVISSLFIAFISNDLLIGKADIGLGIIRIFRFIKYLPWLMWQILLSNIDLVKRTLHPRMPISPTIFCFKNELSTELGMVTLANSITLTPGTITIDVDDNQFIIHAVASELADSLMEGGEMQRRIKVIEGGHGI